ncbi:GGDEF domain-containing protein [Glaciecola sp. XM2]|uniref:GGDEF domain-containing protein n=1 Tax=Glaciecola sp. XM2 TaxID=1914931 RepID=UPI001BDE669A|nr:GGDEF domain-containing protein [Glaciecola sp. XM2]MBT1450135.1 GGDEF domain-containing protein [Glaciecola sp. XM2]
MSKSPAFEASLLRFKQELTRNLVLGFFIVCVIGLPISLSRWFSIGFQPIFVHHILITLIVSVCFFNHNKNHFKLNLVIIITLLSSMIVSGTLSFGLQSGTFAFSAFCAGLIALVWGFRAAISYALAYGAFILCCGYLFIGGNIAYAIEPNAYSNTFSAWAIAAVGTSLVSIFTLISARQCYLYCSDLIDEIEQNKQDMEVLANTDSMTGYCCNRLSMPHLSQAISVAAREGTKVATVFVDLDNFKQINDEYGHTVGDLVLSRVAKRMRGALREIDIPCRVGGDEFLFVLPGLQTAEEVDAIVARIEEVWKQPIDAAGTKLYVRGSVGVAIYPDDGKTADALRTRSDLAMYSTKAQHRICESS